MNISDVISSILSQYGQYQITLPFKDGNGNPVPPENVLRDIIAKTTIPMYSQYQPWIREGTIDIKDLKCIDKRENIYVLPGILTITPVQYILDISLQEKNNRNQFSDINPAFGYARAAQNVITGMEYTMLAGQMRAEPTFKDLGFNKFQLFGFPKTMITIKVACNHEPNGESIEEGCRSSFMQLAELDFQVFLYNNLKYYDELPTAFGPNKLRIEDYQGAAAERKQLLAEWDQIFHLDITDYIEYF